jgi:hypothetical protein
MAWQLTPTQHGLARRVGIVLLVVVILATLYFLSAVIVTA